MSFVKPGSLKVERLLRINHDSNDVGLLCNFVSGQVWNTHRNNHDVPGHVLLSRIAFDPATDTRSADRFHRLTIGIVLGRILEFASDQEGACTSDHVIQFGNIVVRPSVQSVRGWPWIEMEEICAKIV